jgi:hypothetical protein
LYIFADVVSIYNAAYTTLAAKRDAGGGHTSWSASWEACLWARLGAKHEVWRALTKITDRYVTKRLLSLHPPTEKFSDTCKTCYKEKEYDSQQRQAPLEGDKRGMMTIDRSPVRLA